MFLPLNNRILVKPEEALKTTASGIIISTKHEEKPVIGIVVVGNTLVGQGNRVLFSKFGYDEVEVEGEMHYVVSEANILGIF